MGWRGGELFDRGFVAWCLRKAWDEEAYYCANLEYTKPDDHSQIEPSLALGAFLRIKCEELVIEQERDDEAHRCRSGARDVAKHDVHRNIVENADNSDNDL